MIAGCATLFTTDEEIARTCGISAGWHQLKRTPPVSAELLSLSFIGKKDEHFSSGTWTHTRWFGRGANEFAYCRFQVIHGSCDWPNHTVQFQKIDGRWTAEQRQSTICVGGHH
jgi:hypothetical protein